MELPKYKCHKEVWALKIKAVVWNDDESGTLYFEEEGYDPIRVDYKFMKKHWPQPGMYFIVYSDNYSSVSPEKVFEEGYTLIEKHPDQEFMDATHNYNKSL